MEHGMDSVFDASDVGCIKLPGGDAGYSFFKSVNGKHLFIITNASVIYEVVCKKNKEPKIVRVL